MSFRSEHPLVSRENSRGGVGVDLKIVPGGVRGGVGGGGGGTWDSRSAEIPPDGQEGGVTLKWSSVCPPLFKTQKAPRTRLSFFHSSN